MRETHLLVLQKKEKLFLALSLAALLYTSGMSYNMPKDFFGQIMNSGRTLTLHLYQTAMQATSDDAFHIAFATAAVLLVIVFLLNLLAGLVSKTLKKGEQ